MKRGLLAVLAAGLLAVSCASLGDLFLTDQQKQWKAEGRNVQTGLFDEPYSGRSFQERAELDAFKGTAEYTAAVNNYTTWETAYEREQSRVDEIQRRNQAARDDIQRKAQQWIAEVKQEGLRLRHFSPGALFEEKYDRNLAQTQIVAILKVDNQEYARNAFTCQITPETNQVGDYDPHKKY